MPVLQGSQFWVPEVYSSIIQPNQTPPRKVSRMQSTLDREIYSRTQDTSYLQASETDVSTIALSIFISLWKATSEEMKRALFAPFTVGMLTELSGPYCNWCCLWYNTCLTNEQRSSHIRGHMSFSCRIRVDLDILSCRIRVDLDLQWQDYICGHQLMINFSLSKQ